MAELMTAYKFALEKIKGEQYPHMYVNPDGKGKFRIDDGEGNQIDKKLFATYEDGELCRQTALDRAWNEAFKPAAKK